MSLSQRSNLNDKDPYHIYLDLNCMNNDRTQSSTPPILTFNEVRNSPILMNPSEYFLSVVRFTIQTPTLPVFIPQIKTGQSNPNLTIYKVNMDCTVDNVTYFGSAPVLFTPENTFETVLPPVVKQDLDNTYYYINSINSFVTMVNNALSTCFYDLKTNVTNAGKTLPSNNIPFIEYDPTADSCIINADISGYNQNNQYPINIYMNSALYNLFSSFQAYFYGYDEASQSNYKLKIYSQNDLNIYQSSTGVNYLQMYQEYSTLRPLCNPVQSLVFSTGLIPVLPSLVSSPLVFNGSGNVNNTANNDNINPILTDFEVEVTGNTGYKPLVHYTPTAEYRLKDLYGNQPLYAVQMQIYWRTQYGNLIPFRLGSGCSANVKILFRRKEFDVPIHKFESK